MKLLPKPRPYWHVDAKWICGIFLIFTLSAALLLSSLAKLTDEQRGPTISALIIGMLFIRDDAVDDKEVREELEEQGGVIYPLPNIPSIKITEADLRLSPAEISLKVFKPITDSIYNDGLEATAEKFAATPEQREKFVKDAAVFNVFTKESHQSLAKFSKIFGFISLLLALGVVYFSARWGRLSNLGLLLLLISLPGTLLGLMIKNPPKGEGPFSGLRPELTEQIGQAISSSYNKLTLVGILLVVVALIGRIFTAITHKPKPSN